MSSSSPSFIALVVEGNADPAGIDDFVDRWHEESGGRCLHDYLGLTGSEYALWLIEPDMLDVIVRARVQGVALRALVGDILENRGDEGVSVDGARRERLERWLAAQSGGDRSG